MSLGVALSLAEILLPEYDRFLRFPLRLNYLADWRLILAMAGGTIAVGLLDASFYPALVLSGFRLALALKSGGSERSGSGALRSTLVIAQFAVSIGVGIAAMIVFRQINYARSVDLGFNLDDVVVLRDLTNVSPDARESLGARSCFGPRNRSDGAVGHRPIRSLEFVLSASQLPPGPRGCEHPLHARQCRTFAPLYRNPRLLAGETAVGPAGPRENGAIGHVGRSSQRGGRASAGLFTRPGDRPRRSRVNGDDCG